MKSIILCSILLIFYIPFDIFTQRYTVTNGDTVLISELSIMYPLDSAYIIPCNSFEIYNGKIVNYRDARCYNQGEWIFYNDKKELYIKGTYNKKSKQIGIWEYYKDKEHTVLAYKIKYIRGKDIYKILPNRNKEYMYDLFTIFVYKYYYIIIFLFLFICVAKVISNGILLKKLYKGTYVFAIFPLKSTEIKFYLKTFFLLIWRKKQISNNREYKVGFIISNILGIIIIIYLIFSFLIAFFYNP